ncbi:MAG: LPS translocon maturation chaperone LptM [Methylophilaceae bacterium]
MPKTFLTIFLLIFYAALAGCGTKGPLYIPEQRYPQKTQDEVPKTPETTPTTQTNNE